MTEGILTKTALAAAIGVSERTIERMMSDGCPRMLAGKRPRFDLAEVRQWMKERACLSVETKPAGGMSRSASDASAFTAACRRAQLRVMPAASKPS